MAQAPIQFDRASSAIEAVRDLAILDRHAMRD
jgi:hypothetical protein